MPPIDRYLSGRVRPKPTTDASNPADHRANGGSETELNQSYPNPNAGESRMTAWSKSATTGERLAAYRSPLHTRLGINGDAAADAGSLGLISASSQVHTQARNTYADADAGSLGLTSEIATAKKPEPGTAAAIEAKVRPELKQAEEAQVAADSARGFSDYAAADAGSLGLDSTTQKTVATDADIVRREKLPALEAEVEAKTNIANRALATETFEQLGIPPSEANITGFADVLGKANSEEERQQILDGSIQAYRNQETFNAIRTDVDDWVTDALGEQGAMVDREELLKDVQSMAFSGMSAIEIERVIRSRMENISARGLDSISGGTVVEGFSLENVVSTGIALDTRDREATRREVLDTLQVTLNVTSDEDLAEQLGVDVNQLNDTLLVRSAQNAENPDDVIEQLQQNPQYQINSERRRLAETASYALSDAGSHGIGLEEIGVDSVTDMPMIGEIIENSSGVDSVLAALAQSLGPEGEPVAINLTQQQRNELALERGFLKRNGSSDKDIEQHLAIRANNLHWLNQTAQDLTDLQAQGMIPEFGYKSAQQLDIENNAARTAWALGVAADSADQINSQHAENIGVTQGVEDATTRLKEHYVNVDAHLGSGIVGAINYSFAGATGFTDAVNRLQENPSVDEIRDFRDRIDEALNNDIYHLSTQDRAMLEAVRAEFDSALVSAQVTRNAAWGDENLADSQAGYREMNDEFDRVDREAGGRLGKINKGAFSLDNVLWNHADATEEEITAMEVLASIPEEQRSPSQQAAYSVLIQSVLGRNSVTEVESGPSRFAQGDELAAGFESFINDSSKQSIVLGSVIVGSGVSLVNPLAGGAIIVGGTGIGLSADKLTGNDDLTWKEVGTETGISLASLGVGAGVSRFVGAGAKMINVSGRGSQLVKSGATFLTEELSSEMLTNLGVAYIQGDDITADSLIDPVGILMGVTFSAAGSRVRKPYRPSAINPSISAAPPGDLNPSIPLNTPAAQPGDLSSTARLGVADEANVSGIDSPSNGNTFDEQLQLFDDTAYIAPARNPDAGSASAVTSDELVFPTLPTSGAGGVDRLAESIGNYGRSTSSDNLYSFGQSADGRTVRLTSILVETHPGIPRTATQKRVTAEVGNQGFEGDAGGHPLAHRFFPHLDDKSLVDEIFPQDGEFNNTTYKVLENEWADWVDNGGQVFNEVILRDIDNGRPEFVDVSYVVLNSNGDIVWDQEFSFLNSNAERSHGDTSRNIPRGSFVRVPRNDIMAILNGQEPPIISGPGRR